MDLTATQRAIRVIVAQHIPGSNVETATERAEDIRMSDRLNRIGLTDGAFVAACLNIEATYGFDLPDEAWEAAKTPADLAALVDQHVSAEAA